MSIVGTNPVDLFDYDDLEKSYKALAMKYHPDHGGNEGDFVYLNHCYDKARYEIRTGHAIGKNKIYLYNLNKEIEYDSMTQFSPVGKVYVGKEYLVYEFLKDYMKEELEKPIPAFHFIDAKLKDEFSRQIPINGFDIISVFDYGKIIKQFATIKKSPTYLLLSDVMKHVIPLETSVWIFNRLYALGCLMYLHDIYHLDISPHNILVDLEDHTIQLFGGWWFSVRKSERIKKIPIETYKLLTNKMKDTKMPSIEIVSEQIKSVIRQILEGRDIPSPYASWLSLPASEDISQDYHQWQNEVLPKIFPVRKFYKWTI
jgi:serine/threonine protein kinase